MAQEPAPDAPPHDRFLAMTPAISESIDLDEILNCVVISSDSEDMPAESQPAKDEFDASYIVMDLLGTSLEDACHLEGRVAGSGAPAVKEMEFARFVTLCRATLRALSVRSSSPCCPTQVLQRLQL
jgi:hypothetical protein